MYTIRFPDPASKTFTVEIAIPTGKRESVDLMMAIWSPGFYGIRNYARNVSNFSAKSAPDATAAQRDNFAAFMAHSKGGFVPGRGSR